MEIDFGCGATKSFSLPELGEFINEQAPHTEIIGACCEGHPQSLNQISDIQNLQEKVDAGCSSLVTPAFLTMSVF